MPRAGPRHPRRGLHEAEPPGKGRAQPAGRYPSLSAARRQVQQTVTVPVRGIGGDQPIALAFVERCAAEGAADVVDGAGGRSLADSRRGASLRIAGGHRAKLTHTVPPCDWLRSYTPLLGSILLGVFAYKSINAAGADGLVAGSAAFFGKQVAAALITSVYSFGMTFLILKLINLFGSVRVPDAVEMRGLDSELHGEETYVMD